MPQSVDTQDVAPNAPSSPDLCAGDVTVSDPNVTVREVHCNAFRVAVGRGGTGGGGGAAHFDATYDAQT